MTLTELDNGRTVDQAGELLGRIAVCLAHTCSRIERNEGLEPADHGQILRSQHWAEEWLRGRYPNALEVPRSLRESTPTIRTGPPPESR